MRRAVSVFLAAVLVAVALPAVASSRAPSLADPPLISWQPPASFSMASPGGRTPQAGEIGLGPAAFFPITPCRQYDSRSATSLADNTPRAVTMTGAPCGVPGNIFALAVNITVFNILGAGSNGVFKVGASSPPTTAWINYPATESQRGNAGVVATNGTSLFVQVNQGAGSVDFVVDVYGYYYNGQSGSPFDMPAGDFFGIVGVFSGGGVLFGRNDETTGGGAFGVRGWSFSTGTGSAGVSGEAQAATGTVYGVNGLSGSTGAGSAGVHGIVGADAVGSNFSGAIVGRTAANFGAYLLTNTGCSLVTHRVTTGGVAKIEGDFGCSDTQAATFFGNVNVASSLDAGAPGNLAVNGTLSKGGGSFKIDHPLDPKNKFLYHSFVESPDMMNVYNGLVQLDADGSAVVTLPAYFDALNRDYRYQLTSIGMPQPGLYVALEVANNQFVVSGGQPYGRVSWQVTGVRKDPFANAHRIVPEVNKAPEEKGYYLHPIEYGQAPDKGISAHQHATDIEREQALARGNN